eukprot:39563-Pelagomonas_calceolata.AAC.1
MEDVFDSSVWGSLQEGYEGGEVVGRWFMQGAGFMDVVQVLIEHDFLVFHEVELTRVDTYRLAGAHAKVELASSVQ